jgi:uncharacterized protein (TIGR00290 family)
MPDPPKAWLAWSTGKDSAWALHTVRKTREVNVVALLTTINKDYARVAMHAVRERLLELQTASVDLPLVKVPIPAHCRNEDYEQAMTSAMEHARAEGVFHIVFGDLFLEDIRAYREKNLAACSMKAVFPLWRKDTRLLANEMIRDGLSAYITCVDPAKLDRAFAGRLFDAKLLGELPREVDPCGENGEFHSFACAGPMFRRRVPVKVGEIVERDGFVFADLLPQAQTTEKAVLGRVN